MSAQFIFTMYKVGRVVPPDREVLKDISLSFYPGAKIGVIGPNGSGKSTLLRIMAGLDDGYTGEARLSPGFTVGMLEQEPKLDEAKDVTGNVMDGVAGTAKLLTDYDELMAGWADPDADYEALGTQQAELEAKIEAAGAWDLKRTVDIAMDALRHRAWLLLYQVRGQRVGQDGVLGRPHRERARLDAHGHRGPLGQRGSIERQPVAATAIRLDDGLAHRRQRIGRARLQAGQRRRVSLPAGFDAASRTRRAGRFGHLEEA